MVITCKISVCRIREHGTQRRTAALLDATLAEGSVFRMLCENADFRPKILQYISDRFSTIFLMFCLHSKKYAVGIRIPYLPIGAIDSCMAISWSSVRSDVLRPRDNSLNAASKLNPDFVRSGNHSTPSVISPGSCKVDTETAPVTKHGICTAFIMTDGAGVPDKGCKDAIVAAPAVDSRRARAYCKGAEQSQG